MPKTLFIALGGFLAALGVGLGAIGAHALKSRLGPEPLETFHTAVRYHLIHAIGLVLVGLLSLHHRSAWFDGAGWAMLVGVVLFSGGLYVWLGTGSRVFVHIVPFGGTAFILGWLALAVGALRT